MHTSLQLRSLSRSSRAVLSALVLISLAGCLSTSLIERWKNPAFNGPPLRKVLVVAVVRDAGRRRVWESSMVQALMRQHIAATPSYTLYPNQAPSPAELASAAQREGFDGVMATHFVGASRRSYWMPGYAGFGFGWGWRYSGYWGTIYGPGYVETDYRADFQTDVFTVAPNGGELIWTAITQSVDLNSVEATTDQISRVLVPVLLQQGILAPS